MKQPNNLRNRWRRYSQARRAYGMTFAPFRLWARHGSTNPNAYAAIPGQPDETVKLTAPRGAWRGV